MSKGSSQSTTVQQIPGGQLNAGGSNPLQQPQSGFGCTPSLNKNNCSNNSNPYQSTFNNCNPYSSSLSV